MKRIVPFLLLFGCSSTVGNFNSLSFYPPVKPHSSEPKETILVWEEESFSEADRFSIQQTLDTWNVVLNGYIHLAHVDDPVKANWRIVQTQRASLSVEKMNDLAWVDCIGGSKLTVVRDRFLSQRALFSGLLHEEAHLLGAVHQSSQSSSDPSGQNSASEKGAGLMNGKFNLTRYRCVDYWTVRQIAIVHSLDVNQLNYCSTRR